MSEELNEQQDALNLDAGQAQEPELDLEALKEKAAKADEYKKYADRVAAENRDLKKAKEPLTTNESSPISRQDFERLDLKTDGYKAEEIDFIMQNGGRKALENPIVMAGIEAVRAKTKSQNATPSGTGKSAVYQKYTERDLRNMPASELEKIIPQ